MLTEPEREARDAEIRRRAEDTLDFASIAAAVGCSKSTVYEVLTGRRTVYNARRREYARQHTVARAGE
jgi:hypothetical protein